MADEEIEVVRRIAMRLRDCPADVLRRMMAQDTASATSDDKYKRGQTLRLHGRVESVEQVENSLWRYALASETLPHRVVVYIGQVSKGPADRQIGNLPHDEVAVDAVFVKYVPGVQDRPVPVAVAGRMQRRANRPLGGLDFDASLFDGVLDNAPLDSADSGAFYRLLALTRTADSAGQRAATALDAVTAASLFRDPAAARGRLFHVIGVARRAVRVPINDSAAVAQLGTDHYFQIDLAADSLQGNPLTFCTLELPRGMPLGGPPSYRQAIDVTGYFLKIWQYPTSMTAAERAEHLGSSSALQSAPLIIGSSPDWKPAPVLKTNAFDWTAGGILALAITGLGLLLWSLRQSDKEFSRLVRRAFQPHSSDRSG